jgi:hypothetical protein
MKLNFSVDDHSVGVASNEVIVHLQRGVWEDFLTVHAIFFERLLVWTRAFLMLSLATLFDLPNHLPMVLHALLVVFDVLQILLQAHLLVLDSAFAEVEELKVEIVASDAAAVVVAVG